MKNLSTTLQEKYSLILSAVLGLYFFASVETVSAIDYTGAAVVFRLLRYACYAAAGLLALAAMGDFQLENPRTFSRNVLSFLGHHVIFVLMAVLACITSWTSGGLEPAVLVLLVAAASFGDLPVLLRGSFLGFLAGFVLVVLCSLTGVIENYRFVREEDVRYALGFIYPLETQSVMLVLTLLYLVLDWKALRFWKVLASFGANVLLYCFTRGRMSLIMAFLACVLFWLCRLVPRQAMKAWLKKPWTQALMWVCVLFVFLLPLILVTQFDWSDKWMAWDALTNGRIRFGYQGLRDYGIPLFGQKVIWTGLGGAPDGPAYVEAANHYNYVDDAYLKLLIDYGWIAFASVLAGYGFSMRYWMRRGQTALLCALTVVMVLSLSEPRLVQIAMNPFLLALSPALMASVRNGRLHMETPVPLQEEGA